MNETVFMVGSIMIIVGLISYMKGNTTIASVLGGFLLLHELYPPQGGWEEGFLFGVFITVTAASSCCLITDLYASFRLNRIIHKHSSKLKRN